MDRQVVNGGTGRGILADSLVFSSSRYVLLGLSVVRNFVVAKVLGPQDYGYWVVISLVLTYGDQFHFGLRHAGDREIPFLRGRGDDVIAARVSNVLYGGILLLSAIGLAGMGLYVLIEQIDGPVMKMALVSAALILFSDQMNRFYLMVLRAHKEFVLSSKVESIFEVIRTVAVCALAVVFHFAGVLAAFLIASVATTTYFIVRFKARFAPRVNIQLLRTLFASGMPLFFSGLLYIIMISLDRVVAGYVLTKSELGVYGLASLLVQLPLSASLAVAFVVYPRISEACGNNDGTEKVFSLYSNALMATGYLAPMLVAAILYVSEFLIAWLLPQYVPAAALIRTLTNGMFFLVLAPLPLYTLMALGKPRSYLQTQSLSVGIGAILYIAFWSVYRTPLAIASAASISYAVFLVLALASAYRALAIRSIQLLKELVIICFPALYGLAVVWFLPVILPGTLDVSFTGEGWALLSRLVAFSILYLPVLFLLNRRTKLLSALKSIRRTQH